MPVSEMRSLASCSMRGRTKPSILRALVTLLDAWRAAKERAPPDDCTAPWH